MTMARCWLVVTVTVAALAGLATALASVEVEDLTGKQLEAALETEDSLAIYWYSKNCKTCDRVLGLLERLGQEVADNGITLVRVSDKKSAKSHNIRNLPALSLFRNGEPSHFEGDLTSASAMLDFLATPDALDLPGQIEDVSASQLELLVSAQDYVAVFFYTGNKASSEVLEGLKKVDDYCEKLDIALVKINDLELVTEYNLGDLPALVYYRHTIPILYQGTLVAEDDVLEWLIQNRSSGDEDDVIEEVQFKSLEAMVAAVENIAVLFYNPKSSKSSEILDSLETIDDDCDTRGVHFVKIADPAAAYHYGITTLPTLVYFKNSVPNSYEGQLVDDQTVLAWLLAHLEAAEIEEVSQGMLGRLVRDSRSLVVVFCKYMAYAIIALTHTCYLIKNYAPDDLKKFLPLQNVKGLAAEN